MSPYHKSIAEIENRVSLADFWWKRLDQYEFRSNSLVQMDKFVSKILKNNVFTMWESISHNTNNSSSNASAKDSSHFFKSIHPKKTRDFSYKYLKQKKTNSCIDLIHDTKCLWIFNQLSIDSTSIFTGAARICFGLVPCYLQFTHKHTHTTTKLVQLFEKYSAFSNFLFIDIVWEIVFCANKKKYN